MKWNHNIAHYALAIPALALGIHAATVKPVQITPPAGFGTAAYGVSTQKQSRFDWPDIGEDKTIALGEALKALPMQDITLYCSSPTCSLLRADLDDAMQIADWPDQFEDRFVDSEADKGFFVGPPGEAADKLAKALHDATGFDVKIVPIDGIKGLGIIIGKM